MDEKIKNLIKELDCWTEEQILISYVQDLEFRLKIAEKVCESFKLCHNHPGKERTKPFDDYHWRVNHLHVLIDKDKYEAAKKALTEWEKSRGQTRTKAVP